LCGPRRRGLLAGGLLGAVVALRPSLAPLVPLLWLFGLRRPAVAAAAAAAVCVAVTLPVAGLQGWQSWVASVGLLERTIYGDAALVRALGVPIRPPAVLEGHDYAKAAWLAGYSADASITFLVQRAARLTGLAGPGLAFEATWSWLSKLLAFASLAAFAGVALRLGVRARSDRTRIAAALLGALLVDAFVILRVSYADILLLAPLGLLWPALLSARAPRWPAAAVLGGLLLGSQLLLVPTRLGWLGAFVRPFAVLSGLIGCVLWACGPPVAPRSETLPPG
jgi:hypothetical protein